MDERALTKIKQRYGIVGNHEGFCHALEVALKVAPTDLSVLVTGENGTGKEVIPHIIHDYSKRKAKTYLAVNCASIPQGTIESELFGYEKGAFTGAFDSREGYFGAADGGTLFLDEVGELPMSVQAQLLRVLETGEYIRVGANKASKTNVRIVAATNVDLEKAISKGKFRLDLYYRLCSIPIHLPPLRERGAEDFHQLFTKFALEMCEKYGMDPIVLSPGAKSRITAYNWPGNIRQLRKMVEYLSLMADHDNRVISAEMMDRYMPTDPTGGAIVRASDAKPDFSDQITLLYRMVMQLSNEIETLKRKVNGTTQGLSDNGPIGLPDTTDNTEVPLAEEAEVLDDEIASVSPTLREITRNAIIEALTRAGGSRREAARELGIPERTFYRKLEEYGLQ